MQITTDTSFSANKYCGKEIPKTLTFDATFIILTFISDSTVTRRGFQITYQVSLRKGVVSQFTSAVQKVSGVVNMITIIIVVVVVVIIVIIIRT